MLKPICKDCRYVHHEQESGPYCHAPQRPNDQHRATYHLVHGGEPLKKWIDASSARSDAELCGEGGKWFERRRTLLQRLLNW
jgi:hypothetical protein